MAVGLRQAGVDDEAAAVRRRPIPFRRPASHQRRCQVASAMSARCEVGSSVGKKTIRSGGGAKAERSSIDGSERHPVNSATIEIY